MNGYGIGKDLCRQRALGLFGQRSKTGCVVHGDVSQDLAIQGDAGLQQTVHEAAVAQAVDAGSRIDTGDPQRTEVALLLLTADVGVLLCLDDRLLGDAEDLTAGVVIALGEIRIFLWRRRACTPRLTRAIFQFLRGKGACGPDGLRLLHGHGPSDADYAYAWSLSS